MYFKSDQRRKDEERQIGMYSCGIQQEIVNQAFKGKNWNRYMATWLWLKVINHEFAETSVHFAVFSQCQHFTKPVYIFTRGLSAY